MRWGAQLAQGRGGRLAERDDADPGAVPQQLADGAATDGEREAAVAQVIRILTSLALYYLPAPEAARRELTDGRLG